MYLLLVRKNKVTNYSVINVVQLLIKFALEKHWSLVIKTLKV